MSAIRNPTISSDELRRMLRYEAETGRLFWLWRPLEDFANRRAWSVRNAKWAGKEAFLTRNRCGYLMGCLNGRMVSAHRVAWAIATGAWPSGQIDHINGDRSDNRLCNLRSVTAVENSRNRRTQKNNTSGVTGVSWSASYSKWVAGIRVGGRRIQLGYFKSFEDAIRARKRAEVEHGFHPNHGRAA